ncbi:MAG: hypothetical protein LUQ71_06370 [Methanoregula sp.]|nr:hypothetical protein [Methanoregula sp.]
MRKEQKHLNRLWWMASAVVLLIFASAVAPVAAVEWPSNNKTWIPVNGSQYGNTSGYYYFNLSSMKANASSNAIHITDSLSTPSGGIYTRSTYGPDTIYVSDTGGRGGQDDIILMVAINSTTPADLSSFSIDITTSGYTWSPLAGGSPANVTYDENYTTPLSGVSFNSANYLTGSDIEQAWKFAPSKNYPLYSGQVMAQNNLSKLILIDTNVGTINSTWFNLTYYDTRYAPVALEDNGLAKITYNITSTPSNAATIAFNAYAYTKYAAQAPDSVNWINKVNTSTETSGVAATGISSWKVNLTS